MKTVEEKIVNGRAYIVETYDNGFVAKRLKDAGSPVVRPDPFEAILTKLDKIVQDLAAVSAKVDTKETP